MQVRRLGDTDLIDKEITAQHNGTGHETETRGYSMGELMSIEPGLDLRNDMYSTRIPCRLEIL